MIEGIASWLVYGMKELVCSLVFWFMFWVWPWVQAALGYLPSGLASSAVSVATVAGDVFKIANVFLPVKEVMVLMGGYWTWCLAIRLVKLVLAVKP